ncbi:MarR family winged helix-turn-helix transcriptional regulator [Actinocorallia sp. A-T 12471]|uniref:MarR family winged helix-turn-helix transcriptional regulator n=1 Tax=Actinocorallia sp. A-T 12471 TaxID=3089813 RepID=UPI0029D21DA9|nr:MarR family transcriptional regulator [Actinocorallia sp. A-T 12471]MDX6741669.1 MarR family transcriptional regulator [Actinocorallia sp. A-T 12471]
MPLLAGRLRLPGLFEGAGAGLTPSQMLCALLVGQAEKGRMTAGELARELAMSGPSTTALVDRLVKADLLARARGKDRRVVWVSLTERGVQTVERLRGGLRERIAHVLESMDAPARRALVDALGQVSAFADQVTMQQPRPA